MSNKKEAKIIGPVTRAELLKALRIGLRNVEHGWSPIGMIRKGDFFPETERERGKLSRLSHRAQVSTMGSIYPGINPDIRREAFLAGKVEILQTLQSIDGDNWRHLSIHEWESIEFRSQNTVIDMFKSTIERVGTYHSQWTTPQRKEHGKK